jgi:beta-lactam-binding protein with PASTA domain
MELRAAQVFLAVTLALALPILASACGGSTTTVTVTVAPPSPRVVPLVIGLRQALAVQKVTATGLRPKLSRRASASTARGVVEDQLPLAGAKVPHGATVVLIISTGKQ